MRKRVRVKVLNLTAMVHNVDDDADDGDKDKTMK